MALYLIIVGNIEPYSTERDLRAMGRETTIRHIAEGQFDNISRVIEVDLTHGTSRDATDEIAKAVMTRWAHEGEALTHSQYDFVERFVGLNAARSFALEAAE